VEKLLAFTEANEKPDDERKAVLTALVIKWQLPGFSFDASKALSAPVCLAPLALSNANAKHWLLQKIGGAGAACLRTQTILKDNEKLKNSLTSEQAVLVKMFKPAFQTQQALKMQGSTALAC
jgi:hypothetical protein